ncbi:unnamed protein product [Rotaria sp. Silwood1]|nr:unnamed protein product [Rotaria sp. Silwood1]CAF3401934.1 unnamed protein product [Rotaria sp. Silwood1]CAF3432665.1 unnamed protein product [Rotaria sp. Silwood1]CAF4649313.1 unnamed protein product [Rotaria sp. Silwood1]
MTSNSSLNYPAEYYYPEFLESRPDDPLKSPSSRLPITTSIDNGIGSSTRVSTYIENKNETKTKKTPINTKQSVTNIAHNVVIDQGLPDVDITRSLKIDPKKNLLRDPAARNIPRLIVDDNVIKQAVVRSPKIIPTTNLDDNLQQTTKVNQINQIQQPLPYNYLNGNLTNKIQPYEPIKQYPISYVENQQPIDDYWKKEVLIDNEGVVTIEPIKYNKDTYDGPFGLTRKGAFVFYIGMAIFTILAGVFLIMTGIFYAQSYPDSSSNTGKLTGMCICAFAFYLGLQLILIGLWHQKYRQENPTQIIEKSNKHNDSSRHLKSSMENNETYDYTYQQPQIDYTPYDYYSNPPYVSNANEQMLLQQPGAATGAAFYEPVVWPSNVEIETQPDSKFLQPMEWSYGTPLVKPTSLTPAPISSSITNNNSENKINDHYNKKTVVANPPKAKFDNLFPNSTVTEAPLPVLTKAPETHDLVRTIIDQEKHIKKNLPNGILKTKKSNRIKLFDGETESSTVISSDHHRHPSRHHRRQHRHHASSSCSTCSSCSSIDLYSDTNYHSRHYQEQYSGSKPNAITVQASKTHTRTPTKTNKEIYHDTGLEDIPNIQDNHLEQIPVVRRTIIVEPYPGQSNSDIVIKSHTDITGKHRFKKNQNNSTNTNSKTKRNTIKSSDNTMDDIQLEDVNDDIYDNENSKKKKTNKISSIKKVNNAYYN